MNRIFDGKLYVEYSQAYVYDEMEEDVGDVEESFAGQKNGLLGAAYESSLLFTTGLHTGYVNFSVDLCSCEPPEDPTWEEVVEAPFNLTTSNLALYNWPDQILVPIPLAIGTYRVRYSAKAMERGWEMERLLGDEQPVDSYSLAFWPSPLTPDAIIKQTSEVAARWHNNSERLGAG